MWEQLVERWHVWHMISVCVCVCELGVRCQSRLPELRGFTREICYAPIWFSGCQIPNCWGNKPDLMPTLRSMSAGGTADECRFGSYHWIRDGASVWRVGSQMRKSEQALLYRAACPARRWKRWNIAGVCKQTRCAFARGRAVCACGFWPMTPGYTLEQRAARWDWKSYRTSVQGESLGWGKLSEISDVRMRI